MHELGVRFGVTALHLGSNIGILAADGSAADARLADLEATTGVILVLEEGAPDVTADLLAVEGVDVLFIGPTDLSQALGREPTIEEIAGQLAERGDA